MELLTFDELWMRLRSGDESVAIEAKLGGEFGKSMYETFSAFSNEPGLDGGYLLLGIGVKIGRLFQEYEIVGVPNPEQLQSEIATACRSQFSSPISPAIWVENVKGNNVVIAYIPEAKPYDKPVYIKSKGLQLGSFRRIGPTDHHCTDDDIALFYQLREHTTYDESVIEGTDLDDFDPAVIAEYRRLRAALKPDAEELRYNDTDLLYALNAIDKKTRKVTIAGLLLFGTQMALRRHFSLARVDYIRVDGREWVPDPDERYQTVEMSGPLLTLIPKAMSQVLGDIPRAFSLADDAVHRKEVPLIPRNVIREAIVNAVMHRSYRHRQPVQIIRYTNRLEIRNPGHSLVSEDKLGEPGSLTRNEKVAAALHEVGLAETKGTGIRVMRDAMDAANLTSPIFESNRQKDLFSITLLTHHLLGPEDIEWLRHFKHCALSDDEARALIVAREIGAMDNLAYRNINRVDSLTASRHIFRLRDLGLFEQKGKGVNTYYIPTPALLAPYLKRAARAEGIRHHDKLIGEPDKLTSEPDKFNLSGRGLPRSLSHLPTGPIALPKELAAAVTRVIEKPTLEDMRVIIRRLCEWHELKASEIARILHRSQRYIRNTFLGPMIESGELYYVYPDKPNTPRQAYRASKRS